MIAPGGGGGGGGGGGEVKAPKRPKNGVFYITLKDTLIKFAISYGLVLL